MKNIYIFFTVFLFLSTNSIAQNQVENSVLSTGDIYKIAVSESGIYKIDKSYLENLGINTSSHSPSTIQIFGNEGGMLPTSNSAISPDDLMEVPVILSDDNNLWDNDDYILFYAEGPSASRFNEESLTYEQPMNIYDTHNYVFIKTGGTTSKRIELKEYNQLATYNNNSYQDIQRYEYDKINILSLFDIHQGSGKDWYGDYFKDILEKDYISEFNFTDVDLTQDISVDYRFSGRSSSTSDIFLQINDYQVTATVSSTSLGTSYGDYAKTTRALEKISLDKIPASLVLKYDNNYSSAEGWVDYIQLAIYKSFSTRDGQYAFQDERSTEYEFSSYSGLAFDLILDITDFYNPVMMNHEKDSFTYPSSDINKRFLGVKGNVYKNLPQGSKLANQNLHSIKKADLVIVYPSTFKNAAEKLAEHRRNHDNYIVETVLIDELYNEFSSGRIDPTAIRDFAKLLHKRDSNFNYLLLLGDGTYDIRNVKNNPVYHNFIPVYETDNSTNSLTAFPMDDYYAMLDEDEGNDLSGDIDIAVGRLPVSTVTSANDIINKIIHYDINDSRYGKWRSNLEFVADDEDSEGHMADADNIARKIQSIDTTFNQSKIYIDAYVQENTPGGTRYYGASDALNRSVNQGLLVVSYLGHGGPKGWADERVLKKTDIDQWNNYDKMPMMITATCTFAGYDDPDVVSAGEYAILRPNGGVIALLTTVRAVFKSSNKLITESTYDNMFTKDINGNPTFGDIFKSGKNDRETVASDTEFTNIRKYTLLGDPSQKLALPEHKVKTTKINGNLIESYTDTLSAFEEVIIEGIIEDSYGNHLTTFNGTLDITIYDKISDIQTLANDSSSDPFNFQLFRNKLYSGSVEVVNGVYKVTFIVPKDIDYNYGKGRISYYAYTTTSDAIGSFENFIVGSTYEGASSDDEGPEISLFMDTRSFIDGGNTAINTTLLVDLYDDLGINVTGTSIGHDITAILDGDLSTPYNMNDYYNAAANDYQKGTISYPFSGLSIGLHTLELTAWDIANNSTTSTITFNVSETKDGDITLEVYPNPTHDKVYIQNESSIGINNFTATVELYNMSGQLVLIETLENSGSINHIIDFNEKNISDGVYFCKIKFESSELDNLISSKTYKIVKI